MKLDIKSLRSLYRDKTYQEVLMMLSSGVIPFHAEVCLPGTAQWQDLLSFKDLPQYIASKLMLASNGYSHDSLFNHWHIKNAEKSYGPFSLLQMLELYYQKRIHLDNLVRHPSLNSWQTFRDCGPFEVKSLEKLVRCSEIHNLITRRRFPRVSYSNEVFVSVNAELYRGVTWSLSARGLGLVTDQATEIQLGDRLNIIINRNAEHSSVQVKGIVVNLTKDANYERLAVELDHEYAPINQYIDQRVPRL